MEQKFCSGEKVDHKGEEFCSFDWRDCVYLKQMESSMPKGIVEHSGGFGGEQLRGCS